jgi:NADH-quinone oxidoreductase subunit H
MMLALEIPYWGATAIKALVAALVVPTTAFIFGYVFLMKMMSFMQSRLGPMEAGPYGVLQLLADGVKFLQKEDIVPDRADRFVFKLAPMIVLGSTFLMFVVIPAGPDIIIEDLDTGIYFALAISSLSVIGVLMAGWASANKYALLGGIRATGQLIAYELPLVLAVLGVVIQAETLSMQGIVESQANGSLPLIGDALGNPFILTQFVALFIFLAAVQAELTQPPFDMPVAESEIVGGYQVEYTGFRFLLFFLAEFATAFAFAAIASVLFLGGWSVPNFILDWVNLDQTSNWMNLIGPFVLFTKIMVVATIIFWVRFTYPRLREDQLQAFAWKFLIPLALANIVVTAVLKVAF